MMLLRLAWRNLWRNPRRTALTTAAGVFAMLISMLNLSIGAGSHERWIEHAVRVYPGHFQVSQASYREYRTLDYAMTLDADAMRRLDGIHGVSGWVPRLEAWGLISADADNSTGRGVQLFGIDAAREGRLSRLLESRSAGRVAARAQGAPEVTLGALLAKNLGVSLGDSVIVLSADAFGSQSAERFEVVGTFSIGDDEFDGFGALVDLETLQGFLEAGDAVSHVAYFLPESAALGAVGAELRAVFPDAEYEVLPWQRLMPDLEQFLLLDDLGNWLGNGILIVVVGFGLLNTILMSVLERVREFGVLRALGLRPRSVFALVMIESLQLTLLGIAIGFALGTPLVLYMSEHPILLTGEGVRASVELFDLEPLIVFAFARGQFTVLALILIGVGVLASLLPAWRASRGRPVDALREA